MPKPDILILKPLPAALIEALSGRFTLHRAEAAERREAILSEAGPRVRGIAAASQTRIDAALLARLPALEIVASYGVGYDTIDAVAARGRGVVVTNTPDVLTDEVADLALGLLLAAIRQIPQADRHLRAGLWAQRPFPLTATLRGRKVGILGLGRIGGAIAARLEGFGVHISYHGRRRRPDAPYDYHPSLLQMARAVDTLMIVAPGGPETDGLVSAAVLEALGPDGIVVNVARGSVVDEPALIAALASGAIAGAGLDVFADEPRPPAALIALDHVVLLPHVGSGSVATRDAMGRLLVENLLSWFSGKGPLTPAPETPWSGAS